MVIGPVQPGLREALHQPAEQRLVAHVQPHGDLGLLAVAAERRLADQDPDEQAVLELGERRHTRCSTRLVVSPGKET